MERPTKTEYQIVQEGPPKLSNRLMRYFSTFSIELHWGVSRASRLLRLSRSGKN